MDLSVALRTGMVHWPDNPPVRIERMQEMERGDSANVSRLALRSHTGTHMDAPLHFVRTGRGLDEMPISAVIGPARVVEIQDPESIKAQELVAHHIQCNERILFKTRNSPRCWQTDEFLDDFVYISQEAARYLVGCGIQTVGVDYLSVGGFHMDGPETHHVLLESGVWIIEGLDLTGVVPGPYDLICLPLRVRRSGGATARAILRRRESEKVEEGTRLRTIFARRLRASPFLNLKTRRATVARMKAVQVSKSGGEWELIEREVPDPGSGQIRIKVEACGVCHSDMFVKDGLWPNLQYPRVPGHEIAGRVDDVGPHVTQWEEGQRVGVGWYGGHCGHCDACRHGDFILCRVGQVCGISYDGGWAEYVVVPAEAVAALPDDLSAEESAPLLCAGVTTFNSLRNSGAKAGDIVAVQGIGGLGHLGVQFSARLGYRTVAIGRGLNKEPLARQLGAVHYIDTCTVDPADELQRLGGARVILATAPDGKGISSLAGGLGHNGQLLIVAAPGDPITLNAVTLITQRASVQGWPSGTAKDSEETLRFSALARVRPMIERYPLHRAAEAYQHMMNGEVRFRAVLAMSDMRKSTG
ncbi:hypothetical protein YTPLAS72_14560 [Nitrospira sp.]|nr:hypothetical protein YTPLAS72_14560 [Nitrospira sp.]